MFAALLVVCGFLVVAVIGLFAAWFLDLLSFFGSHS